MKELYQQLLDILSENVSHFENDKEELSDDDDEDFDDDDNKKVKFIASHFAREQFSFKMPF